MMCSSNGRMSITVLSPALVVLSSSLSRTVWDGATLMAPSACNPLKADLTSGGCNGYTSPSGG
eukprot:1559167-Pyramimonas_sp.AAC.1